MKTIADILVLLVAVLHFWFLMLEMFFWRKPIGLKTFRNSPEKAETTAVLAANQGLYNGFLAAGLMMSFFFTDPSLSFAFRIFFLSCITIAGIYGGWSANRKIIFVQALPAALALVLTLA